MDPQTLGTDPRLWLFATVPLSILGFCGLAYAIWKLVAFFTGGGLQRLEDIVPAVPIAAEQVVAFPQAGEVALTLDARLGSMAFMGVSFELVAAQTGRPVPGRVKLFRFTQTALDGRTRLQYGRYAIPAAGRYLLRMKGLEDGRDYSRAAVSFTREASISGDLLPAVAGAFLRIVATIVMAALAIGMAVLSALIWSGDFPAGGQSQRTDARQDAQRK